MSFEALDNLVRSSVRKYLKTCEKVSFVIYDAIMQNVDIGKDVRFIFCDISKAFDRVWHRGLLYKLRKYGIKGNLLKLTHQSDAQVLRLFKSEFRDSAVSF
jgi:hypothetical protein